MTPATPVAFVSDMVYPAAMAFLPERMDSPEAKALVLAIGMQESGFAHRKQVGGPARGFWQFEEGGVNAVLGHSASKSFLDPLLPLFVVKPWECHAAIAYNDILALILARLLLWTHPSALPKRENVSVAWGQYLDCWRPGKPHRETWEGNFERAWGIVDLKPT